MGTCSNLSLMFYVGLDLSSLLALGDNLQTDLEKAGREAAEQLTLASHSHLLELVQEKLHSTREKYLEGVSFKQIDKDTWAIELDPKMNWLEDGMPEHSMLDALLSSPKAKTAKDGSKYLAVPFQHNKGPSSQTPMQTSLTNLVKAEFKARQIPYGGIEKDATGKPKTGLLHAFDVEKRGKGAVPVSKSGISLLAGVRVYQKEVKDKQGNSSVKKAVMTFRMASSKHPDKWRHPGLEARNFMEQTYEWALKEWDKKILPDLIAKVTGDK